MKLELLREATGRVASGADEEGGIRLFGDIGRDGGGLGWDAAAPLRFMYFFREDSLPLASERLGDPGRLSDLDCVV